MAAGVEGLKGFSCIILVFYHEGSGIVNDPRDAAMKIVTRLQSAPLKLTIAGLLRRRRDRIPSVVK